MRCCSIRGSLSAQLDADLLFVVMPAAFSMLTSHDLRLDDIIVAASAAD